MKQRKLKSKRARLLLLGIFLTFIFASNMHAQQSGRLIESIDILGNRRLTDEEILNYIKTRPGQLFDEKRTQTDLQSLLKLGFFDNAQTRILTEEGIRGGLNVIFEVRELPLIVEVKFDGLRYVAKDELLAELRAQKAEITANSPYQPEKLRKARTIIAEYLSTKRGYIDVKVTVSEESVSATTVIVSFYIDEMPNDGEQDCCCE